MGEKINYRTNIQVVPGKEERIALNRRMIFLSERKKKYIYIFRWLIRDRVSVVNQSRVIDYLMFH